MRRPIPALLCALVAMALACGCETHNKLSPARADFLSAGIVTDPEQVSRLRYTDEDIADLLDAKITPKLPTKLAIAHLRQAYGSPELLMPATEQTDAWREALVDGTSITGLEPVTPLTLSDGQTDTLKGLRVAAARTGCELLLVTLRGSSSVTNYNGAAALYWTFVGLWLVPGNEYEHQTVVNAILVDTRTGFILATAQGDSHEKRIFAAAYQDIYVDQLSAKTPVQAMDKLRPRATEAVKRLVKRTQASRTARVR